MYKTVSPYRMAVRRPLVWASPTPTALKDPGAAQNSPKVVRLETSRPVERGLVVAKQSASLPIAA